MVVDPALASGFLSPLSEDEWIVGIAGPDSPGMARTDGEEIVMSTPNEAGAPESGSQTAAENSSEPVPEHQHNTPVQGRVAG
jgi:hypothetical protein